MGKPKIFYYQSLDWEKALKVSVWVHREKDIPPALISYG
jgi:hypothetical protein